jgi:1,4-dihydroxy-2-naphthoyl-CoA hydrolase
MTGADLAGLVAAMPFAAAVGIELESAGPDEVVGVLAWAPERCTAGGVMHGGALMTLADSVGALCAFLGLPEGATTATTGSATNLFRPVTEGTVTATARPLHRGRRSVVVQTDLVDSRGRRVAQVTQTQAVLA